MKTPLFPCLVLLVLAPSYTNPVNSQSGATCIEEIQNLNDLAFQTLDSSITGSINLGNTILSKLSQCPDSLEYTYAHSILGEAYYYRGNLPQAQDYFDSSFMYLPTGADSFLLADLYLLRSNTYSDMGMAKSALSDLTMALQLYIALEDSMQIGISHYNLGILQFDNKNYKSAYNHFM